MLRGAVIVGLMAVGSFQPLFGEDFKFKVTPTRDFTLGLTIFGGPLLVLDACWSKAAADLDWVLLCDYGGEDLAIAAISESTEEKCEDLQVGIFGGNDGLDCVAALISARGTGKGNGAFRFTGSELSARRGVKAAKISVDNLPRFREKLEEFKAASRHRKTAK